MKIKGNKIIACNIYTVVIPKADQSYVFKIGPANMNDFDNLCPRPKPPNKIVAGSDDPIKDVNNPKFKEDLDDYAKRRMSFMFMSSISHTEDLEFDTVDMSDPNTWDNYSEELKEAGFTEGEIIHLLHKVVTANGLNNEIIDKATDDFLASMRQKDSESK